MICASKKKNVVQQPPPAQPQPEPAKVVDTGPIHIHGILGLDTDKVDIAALEAKLDKLIAYLEQWCRVGNISMEDIRAHLS